MIEKICVVCGNTYMARNRTYKVCSQECRAEYNRMCIRKYRENFRELYSPKTGPSKLDIDAKKAEEHGVSYGYYMAVIKPKGVDAYDSI